MDRYVTLGLIYRKLTASCLHEGLATCPARSSPRRVGRGGVAHVTLKLGTAGGLVLETLRRAQEEHDLELMVDLYAEDAVLRRLDRNNPPSLPVELKGKREDRRLLGGTSSDLYHDPPRGGCCWLPVSCSVRRGSASMPIDRGFGAENLELRGDKIGRRRLGCRPGNEKAVEETDGKGSGMEVPALLLALIHRSAWNRSSANFRFTEF